jgi:hypothetical protein
MFPNDLTRTTSIKTYHGLGSVPPRHGHSQVRGALVIIDNSANPPVIMHTRVVQQCLLRIEVDIHI